MLRHMLVGVAALFMSSAAIAGDPFDDARYYLQVKQNAEALTIVDSGQFDVNMQTEEGFGLLHYAAGAGNLEMVRALLARGANPHLKSQSGTTPYQMAIGTMVQAEIRKAIAKGAGGARTEASGQSAAAPGRAGTPSAAGNGMCAMVRSDPVNDGRSPAMRPFLKAKDAIWYNHPDELIGLIEDCVGVNDQDQYGWTLLHHAADRDRVALAKILLDHGARRSIRNKDGQTAPQLATSPEMKALLGATSAKPAAATGPAASRKVECQQKYQADAALASDTTGKLRAMRRWQQCLNTGRYW
ncbi:ankyrin repeat domain-containing protein [Novosphingobium sp. Chol11]|uniref:ankyrin repeat domain-containing protein n=1 Tax=Novosphingobium sp. Chol11 TaxID=1385763 RepID=UPI000BE47972|nr:ankyrin repeat domain-containing protein [Novosphingobium sp. Chol11]